MRQNQRGVALLTALLVVAIATTLAVAMTHQQQMTLRRTANLLHTDQAYWYALGAEAWAQAILRRDNNAFDHEQELWATDLPPTPVPGGYLQGHLQDLSGRFNVNNLLTSEGEVNRVAYVRLRRLLTYLQLPLRLADELIDWIDANLDIRLPHGAEDDVYLLKSPAYRPANQPLRSPSELRLLHSMTAEYYTKLAPFIYAATIGSAININTAPLPILMSLADNLDENQVKTLLNDRQTEPFKALSTFSQHPSLAGIELDTAHLAVKTQYFLFSVNAEVERGRVRLRSVLQRQPSHINVLTRSRDVW